MSNGLDDVVAAETVLSDVDGIAGQLAIRGKSLSELSGHWSFEEVVELLFTGFFDDLPTGPALRRAIGEARRQVFDCVEPILKALAPSTCMTGCELASRSCRTVKISRMRCA